MTRRPRRGVDAGREDAGAVTGARGGKPGVPRSAARVPAGDAILTPRRRPPRARRTGVAARAGAGLRGAAARKAGADAHAAALAPVVAALQDEGTRTLRALAAALNGCGARTTRGGAWQSGQVCLLLARLARLGLTAPAAAAPDA